MAGSVNKVILIGNLGRDPEVRTFQNGGKVCNLAVATSERWRDRQTGENREKTEWHRVAIFNENLVRLAEQYLRKGSKVYLEGQLETRKWQDQSGQERFTTEVVLRPYRGEMTFLDGRDGPQASAGGAGDDRGYETSGGDAGGGAGGGGRSGGFGGGSSGPGGPRDMDDDIPFCAAPRLSDPRRPRPPSPEPRCERRRHPFRAAPPARGGRRPSRPWRL